MPCREKVGKTGILDDEKRTSGGIIMVVVRVPGELALFKEGSWA